VDFQAELDLIRRMRAEYDQAHNETEGVTKEAAE